MMFNPFFWQGFFGKGHKHHKGDKHKKHHKGHHKSGKKGGKGHKKGHKGHFGKGHSKKVCHRTLYNIYIYITKYNLYSHVFRN